MLYNKFSNYLKNRYESKVYKLPVNIPVTCPNRDGRLSTKGCIFCGDEGAGFESLPDNMDITDQLKVNSRFIKRKYNCNKFIAYFQNYTNTYMPLEQFRTYIEQACMDNIVAIYISTRPDCINNKYLEFLETLKRDKETDIVIELGLQTVNYHTLEVLNRGHGLAEFIDAVLSIKKFNLELCVHYIVDIPMDKLLDVTEGAKIISALRADQVKCHSLYILKDTVLGNMYDKGTIEPVCMDEYLERVISFLEYLDPGIVIQRLISRAPKNRSLFCNWGTSWWKIRDIMEDKMKNEGRYQGRRFDYLNGNCICTGTFF